MKSCPICRASVTYVGMNGIECLSPKSRCQNGVGSEQVTLEWHPGMLLAQKADGVIYMVSTVRPTLHGMTALVLESFQGNNKLAVMPVDAEKWERWPAS